MDQCVFGLERFEVLGQATAQQRATRPSMWEMASFLQALRRGVLEEAALASEAIQQQWARPLADRVAEGRAIAGVEVLAVHPGGTIEVTCRANDSRFREGDLLCLHRGDPQTEPHLLVTLEVDEETVLVLAQAERASDLDRLRSEPDGWILDEGHLDLSDMILGALQEAGASTAGRERVLPLLMCHQQPATDAARYEQGLTIGERAGLNWSQTEALAQAYATDLAHLIQGPPGTGKTRVLAHLAEALAGEGERVLVTALTHRAIHNALNKVAAVAPELPVVKIGPGWRAGDLEVESFESFHETWLTDLEGGYVVGATPFAACGGRLSGVSFDTVIMDEASQITLPLAIMGMLKAERYLFVGDQKQLPPVRRGRTDSLLVRSVFEALAGRGFETMLEETYRLNAELSEWPSRTFYGGRLRAHPGAAARRLATPRTPARLAQVLDPAHPKVFLDLAHSGRTTRSPEEAEAVADLVATLLDCGPPPEEIGVVVPYRAQAREIRRRLRGLVPDDEQRRAVVVDTVERMQGQERDVVLLSLTTSDAAWALGLADFFFQPERLNVAVTRPRVKLIVVGSRHVLASHPTEPSLAAAVALLRDLLDSCFSIQGEG